MLHKVIVTDPHMGAEPFNFGVFDAKQGYTCDPVSFFTGEDCIVHYALGYLSVLPDSETAKDILKRYDSPDIHKEYTTCEFMMRLRNPDTTWSPTYEAVVRAHLRGHQTIEALIARMRAEPTFHLVVTTAEFYFIAEEPAQELQNGESSHPV